MIELDSVRFGYSRQAPIFDQFSWSVATQESWAIVGPSGCGKSTLLYLLAGLRIPESGSIKIHSLPLVRPRPRTGLILQDYGLLPWATVEQNANLGLSVHQLYGPDGTHAPSDFKTPSDSSEWLKRLGIHEIAEKYPSQISGGQRQRTAIARTLAITPDLLLMDEPFSSLDATTRSDLQSLTQQLCLENNLTMIVVTHLIEEAAILGQKILFLGKPPHCQPVILNNEHSTSAGFTLSTQFLKTCQTIRDYLEGV